MKRVKPSQCRTGKRRYSKKVDALIALMKLKKHDDGQHREKRAYKCEFCRGFHLTKQEPDSPDYGEGGDTD